MHSLTALQLASLRSELSASVASAAPGALAHYLDAATFEHLSAAREQTGEAGGLVTDDDLRFLAGYLEFLGHRGRLPSPITAEVRVERRSGRLRPGYLGFVLLPLEASLITEVESLFWTHSEDLARERFLASAGGPYLCGSHAGRSKFFVVGREWSRQLTKLEAIEALGLAGYEKVGKPGPLYVIQATMERLAAVADLRVAVVYKSRTDDQPWQPMPHFLEGSIPAFTSGGLAEVVGLTFNVDAADLDELARNGIRIFRFD